jgi:hypothetical protein
VVFIFWGLLLCFYMFMVLFVYNTSFFYTCFFLLSWMWHDFFLFRFSCVCLIVWTFNFLVPGIGCSRLWRREKILAPVRNETLVVQPVACHYTHWTLPALLTKKITYRSYVLVTPKFKKNNNASFVELLKFHTTLSYLHQSEFILRKQCTIFQERKHPMEG